MIWLFIIWVFLWMCHAIVMEHRMDDIRRKIDRWLGHEE